MTVTAKKAPAKVSNKYKGKMVESHSIGSRIANIIVTLVVHKDTDVC